MGAITWPMLLYILSFINYVVFYLHNLIDSILCITEVAEVESITIKGLIYSALEKMAKMVVYYLKLCYCIFS